MRTRRKLVKFAKMEISKIILFFLYRAFRVSYHLDTNIQKEIAGWKDNMQIEIKTEKNGPSLIIKKKNDEIERVKEKIIESDICIEFKSIDAAFLMLTGRLGVAKAYAEHRFILKGDISEAMSFVRCVDMIESYLFPKFMTNRILKEQYKKQMSSILMYVHVLINKRGEKYDTTIL